MTSSKSRKGTYFSARYWSWKLLPWPQVSRQRPQFRVHYYLQSALSRVEQTPNLRQPCRCLVSEQVSLVIRMFIFVTWISLDLSNNFLRLGHCRGHETCCRGPTTASSITFSVPDRQGSKWVKRKYRYASIRLPSPSLYLLCPFLCPRPARRSGERCDLPQRATPPIPFLLPPTPLPLPPTS